MLSIIYIRRKLPNDCFLFVITNVYQLKVKLSKHDNLGKVTNLDRVNHLKTVELKIHLHI